MGCLQGCAADPARRVSGIERANQFVPAISVAISRVGFDFVHFVAFLFGSAEQMSGRVACPGVGHVARVALSAKALAGDGHFSQLVRSLPNHNRCTEGKLRNGVAAFEIRARTAMAHPAGARSREIGGN